MMQEDHCFKWLVLVVLMCGVCSSIDHVHHSNDALQSNLQKISREYDSITKLYSIGKSIDGFDLWVIAIGKDIDTYVPLRPHVKYIGNMHGNEAVSREVLLYLVDYFVTSYATNTTIRNFLDTTVVHIMPSMNPDGYARASEGDCTGVIGRNNADDIDLNRNFPDVWFNKHIKPITRETQHVMDWLSTENFVLSANLHGGTVVANYPFDQYRNDSNIMETSISPDDDTFRFLALTYSRSHQKMALTNGGCFDYFEDGITNGADWYPVAGGMQDYNYLVHGIFELTLELSCCKFPMGSELQGFWTENKDALVNYLFETHRGVKGIIYDENNNTISNVTLVIVGREMVPFSSRKYGEYYRILLPGTYSLQINTDDYKPVQRTFTVAEGVTHLDITLESTQTTQTTQQQPPNSAKVVSEESFSLLCMLCITLFML